MKYVQSLRRPLALALVTAASLGAALAAAGEYFIPQHQLLGIGAGRSDITPEIVAARTDRMIQSQTFVILRDPQRRRAPRESPARAFPPSFTAPLTRAAGRPR